MSAPIVKVEMLIRKPAPEVFNAFADPAITTRFWFTKSSGKLEAGKRLRWDWEMYGVSDEIDVKSIDPGRRIVFEWSFPDSTLVEWVFTPRGDGATLVSVTNSGFKGDTDSVIAQALDSTQGFNIVLCAAKIWLERGVEPRFIADKSPDHHVSGWESRT